MVSTANSAPMKPMHEDYARQKSWCNIASTGTLYHAVFTIQFSQQCFITTFNLKMIIITIQCVE